MVQASNKVGLQYKQAKMYAPEFYRACSHNHRQLPKSRRREPLPFWADTTCPAPEVCLNLAERRPAPNHRRFWFGASSVPHQQIALIWELVGTISIQRRRNGTGRRGEEVATSETEEQDRRPATKKTHLKGLETPRETRDKNKKAHNVQQQRKQARGVKSLPGLFDAYALFYVIHYNIIAQLI